METAFTEVTERLKYRKYGDHPRIERSGKDTERTEEVCNDNKPPTIDNVRSAIERLKNNRAPGSESIIAELLKIKGYNRDNPSYNKLSNLEGRKYS